MLSRQPVRTVIPKSRPLPVAASIFFPILERLKTLLLHTMNGICAPESSTKSMAMPFQRTTRPLISSSPCINRKNTSGQCIKRRLPRQQRGLPTFSARLLMAATRMKLLNHLIYLFLHTHLVHSRNSGRNWFVSTHLS